MSSNKLDKNRFAKYALSAPSAASFSYYIVARFVQEYFYGTIVVDIYGAKIYYTNQINFEKIDGWVTKI